jgi:hypothetical protein
VTAPEADPDLVAGVPPPSRPLLKRLERYVLAHVAAYPVAFLWAVAAIPLTIHLFHRELDALDDDMPAVGDFVVRRLAWPAGVAFVLPHLLALPWAFARHPTPFRRAAWIGIAAVAALGLAFGAGSWLWLFLR